MPLTTVWTAAIPTRLIRSLSSCDVSHPTSRQNYLPPPQSDEFVQHPYNPSYGPTLNPVSI
ncbi:hypothetical protein INR49_030650 [Caranx melampygus]|nr:hypothetical protein INR49_030650 [Caranx melampygus]